MPPSEQSEVLNAETTKEEKIDGENVIFHCTLNNDQELLSK